LIREVLEWGKLFVLIVGRDRILLNEDVFTTLWMEAPDHIFVKGVNDGIAMQPGSTLENI